MLEPLKNIQFLLIFSCLPSTTHPENIIFSKNQSVSMNCSYGENLLISNIKVHQAKTRCQRQPCKTTKIKGNIMDMCHRKTSCNLSSELANGCLDDYGHVDLSYSCNDAIWVCDFEDLSCPFNTSINDVQFQRIQAKIQNPQIGPVKDHTTLTGNGYYAFANSSYSRIYGASFETPLVLPSINQCLSFWIFMHGYYRQRLYIYQRNDRYLKILLRLYYKRTREWHHQELTLHSTSQPFHIVFRTVHGGFIAIDDIYIRNTKCNEELRNEETCLPLSKPIRPLTCSIVDNNIQILNLTFEPEFEECSETYNSVRSYCLEQCKKADKSACSTCFNEALQRSPECFMLNKIEIEYVCAEIEVKFISIEIIGGVSGSAVFVLCVVLLIVFRLRIAQKKKSDLNQKKISDKNYYNMDPISTLPGQYCNVSYQNEPQPTNTDPDNTTTSREHNYTELDNTKTSKEHNYTELDKTITGRQHLYTELDNTNIGGNRHNHIELENSKSANGQLDNTNTSRQYFNVTKPLALPKTIYPNIKR